VKDNGVKRSATMRECVNALVGKKMEGAMIAEGKCAPALTN